MKRFRRSVLLACALGSVVGCGSSDSNPATTSGDGGTDGSSTNPDGGGGTTTLALSPHDGYAVIDLSANAGASVTYKVTATDATGDHDVSASASLSLDDAALGAFAGPVLTTAATLPSNAALAKTGVKATASGATATGSLLLGAYRKTGDKRDLLFTANGGALAPAQEILKVGSTIAKVDVMFLVDSSAPNAPAIAGVKSGLSSLVTQLGAAVPNLGVGLAEARDFPEMPFGAAGDFPVKVDQAIDTDAAKTTTAISALTATGGGDIPTSEISAMQYLLTGGALTWPSGSLAAHTSPAGRAGGADFRSKALPVLVALYGSTWHDAALDPYSFTTPTMTTLKSAFAASNAKFVGVGVGVTTEGQPNELSDASKSNVPPAAFGASCTAGQCCTDVNGAARAPQGPGGTCRLNFLAASDGSGLTGSLVKAVQAIVVGSKLDATFALENDPLNGSFDATKLVKVAALDTGDAPSGCPATTAKDTNGDGTLDTFLAVAAGTPLCFQVTTNTAALPAATALPQVYAVAFEVLGQPGNVLLDRRTILFVIPPKP